MNNIVTNTGNISTKILSSAEATVQGFSTFNGYDHVCIDLDGKATVSVKTKDGKKITFCFNVNEQGISHSVDIKAERENQQAIVFNNGSKTILDGGLVVVKL